MVAFGSSIFAQLMVSVRVFSGGWRFCALAVSFPFCTSSQIPVQPVAEQAAIRAIDAAELRRETRLRGYTVTEHYTIKSSRFHNSAEMTVAVEYQRDKGKTYKVISRTGSAMLQSRVFDRLLREEGEMSRGEARQGLLMNSRNYEMRLKSEENREGRKTYVLDLTPRKASPHLLKGRAWIDAEDGTLMRIEGRPTASSSFFAGRPMITREYEKVGDLSLAKSTIADSSSFFFGKTELHIEYNDYHIDVESTR
jgi:hypothetical protein